ncbi:pancreatic triacylglycerol lipase-like [Macrobrachium nipponense]|uniref:pancreatic triacylglycerol lipase-like n=1 Tax=Macrobrachium nipponense TaxID=159736 RepID=UPI0030C86311
MLRFWFIVLTAIALASWHVVGEAPASNPGQLPTISHSKKVPAISLGQLPTISISKKVPAINFGQLPAISISKKVPAINLGDYPTTEFHLDDVASFFGIEAGFKKSFRVLDLYRTIGQLGALDDVKFLLWTRSNTGDDDYYNLQPGNLTNLALSPFDPSFPTLIIFHGFADNGKNTWILHAKKALLELQQCNVISVDWWTLVLHPWYREAAMNSFKVANYTAGFIDWLNEQTGLLPSNIHITGHSLGAHAAGFTGKYIKCGQIGRITGLDPAGPLFYFRDADHRIDKSHAAYVDIIHSNSGQLVMGCYGLYEAVGHADFYPNGGRHQPGCIISGNATILDDWQDLMHNCSHARVTDFWVESITALEPSQMFTAWPCHDYECFASGLCTVCGPLGCPHMGFHVEKSMHGIFYLNTRAEPPYAQGDQQ